MEPVERATPVPGLDAPRLRAHLDGERPGLVQGPLQATVFRGGRSNLTYLVTDGSSEWVLRRPPLGHVLATAHDMAREFRVISALAGVIPVPRTLLLCRDEEVIGTPFFLMERVHGTVYRTAAQTAPLPDGQKEKLAFQLMDVLAALHAVDPASVGLADLGHPEGFLARQVSRWSRQLEQSRSRDLAWSSFRSCSARRSPSRRAPPSCTATTGWTTSSSTAASASPRSWTGRWRRSVTR